MFTFYHLLVEAKQEYKLGLSKGVGFILLITYECSDKTLDRCAACAQETQETPDKILLMRHINNSKII